MTSSPIIYRLYPFDLAGHRYRITLTIANPCAQGQRLSLPAWIPGSYLVRDFSRQVETFAARINGQPIDVAKVDSHTWQVAPCKGPLQIEITVYAWDLSVRGAHLDETHAFFNGTSVFLRVEGQEDLPCLIDLVAPPRLSHWKVYTSLPEARGLAGQARRHGFGYYQAPNYDALIDHPVEMGLPQTASFKAHGAEHEIVFTGRVPNLDLPRISHDIQRICETQIAFFEPQIKRAPFLDSSTRYVFITMVTQDGYGGLEHRASTALITSRNALPTKHQAQHEPHEDYYDFLGLVSHEYFHMWNVKRIKPAAFVPYHLNRPNFTSLLWVFEGFTSYYDDLFLLRAGVIQIDDYLKRIAKTISQVVQTPGRLKQSVAQSSFDAWTRYYKQDEHSPNAIISYYTKGACVALGLDLTIRTQTNGLYSLDHVMDLMWQRYGRLFYQGQAQGVEEDALPALIQEATGVDVQDYIAQYVYGLTDIPLAQLLASHSIETQWKADADLPYLGWKIREQGENLQISTVFENSPAHQAGLSAGDWVIAIDHLRVKSANDLTRLLARYQAGASITIHGFRRDELRVFQVSLAQAPVLNCTLAQSYPTVSLSN